MGSEFMPFVKWIDKNYYVKTINIIYDTIDNSVRPRLQIFLKTIMRQTNLKVGRI